MQQTDRQAVDPELRGTAPSDWIAVHAAARPQQTALTQGQQRLSYADLDEQVARFAEALGAFGVRPGDRVATLLHNSIEFVITFLATLRAGAIALPMNPEYRESEIERYFDEARPRVIVADREFTSLVNQVLANRSVINCVLIGCPEGKGAWYRFPELIAHHRPSSLRERFDPSVPALWLHSSGSTGSSKRVSRTRAQLAAEAEAFRSKVGTTAEDAILCAVPLSHAHGLGNGLLAAAYAGANLVLLERFEAGSALRAIREERVTLLPAVPLMYRALASTQTGEDLDLSSLRLCFSSGAPLSLDTFRAFRERYGISVRQLFGSTETGAVAINLDDDIESSHDSVGTPLEGIEFEVFGPDGHVLDAGQEGVVGVRSPAMFSGYEERTDLNERAFRSGYFFPGDRGCKDEQGRIRITGRDTAFINLGANKVDPAEVERVLCSHPRVLECVVLGVQQAGGDEVVKAVIVASGGCEEDQILDHCRDRIAAFKVPRIIEFRSELPRSPLGKVLRKYLAQPGGRLG